MNMQYAQAVLAHEQAQRQRLDAGPITARYAPPSRPPYGGPPRHSLG
jgi:hypothetical protein